MQLTIEFSCFENNFFIKQLKARHGINLPKLIDDS